MINTLKDLKANLDTFITSVQGSDPVKLGPLRSSSENAQGQLLSLNSRVTVLEENRSKLNNDVATLAKELEKEEQVHELLLAVSDYILQNDPVRSMETIIADIMQKIVDPHIISFNIKTIEKRNQLETYFTVTREVDGVEYEEDILECVEGGGTDVAFLLIRIILLVNHPSKPRRILFADEPIKNLSHDRRDQFMVLLRQITEEFDVQIIMTTHETSYIEGADCVVRFTKENGITNAKTI